MKIFSKFKKERTSDMFGRHRKQSISVYALNEGIQRTFRRPTPKYLILMILDDPAIG